MNNNGLAIQFRLDYSGQFKSAFCLSCLYQLDFKIALVFHDILKFGSIYYLLQAIFHRNNLKKLKTSST